MAGCKPSLQIKHSRLSIHLSESESKVKSPTDFTATALDVLIMSVFA